MLAILHTTLRTLIWERNITFQGICYSLRFQGSKTYLIHRRLPQEIFGSEVCSRVLLRLSAWRCTATLHIQVDITEETALFKFHHGKPLFSYAYRCFFCLKVDSRGSKNSLIKRRNADGILMYTRSVTCQSPNLGYLAGCGVHRESMLPRGETAVTMVLEEEVHRPFQ
jgi:hypothetical protein